eukprot:3181264-Rhodomonas_salina.2
MAMSGTDLAYAPTSCYAMSSTELAYAPIPTYAMSGTELAYGATRHSGFQSQAPADHPSGRLSSYPPT